MTGVLIGGSGATVSPMHVGTQPCVLVRSFSSSMHVGTQPCVLVRSSPCGDTLWLVCCMLSKGEGELAGGGEGRDEEVEDRGNEMVWS